MFPVSGNKIHYLIYDADPNGQACGKQQDVGLSYIIHNVNKGINI